MATKFRKGEVAVLLNDNGGRLFQVFRYVGQGRYKEKSSYASQQPYALEVSETHLVKCKGEADAAALIEVMQAAEQVMRDEISQAKAKRNAAQRQAVMAHNLAFDTT